VLSRQQELEQTQQEITHLELLISQQNDSLRLAENDYEQVNGLAELSVKELKQNEKHKHDLELEFTKYSQLNEQFIRRNQQISSELVEIQQSLEQEREANQLLTEHRKKLHEITQQCQQVSLYANTCDNKINEANNKLASINENSKSLTDTQYRLNDEINKLSEKDLQEQLATLNEKRKIVEQTLSEARQEVENIMNQLREKENTHLACEHKTHKLKDEINQALASSDTVEESAWTLYAAQRSKTVVANPHLMVIF